MCDLTNPAFTNEDKAREFLEASRWPDGPVCPFCGQLETVANRLAASPWGLAGTTAQIAEISSPCASAHFTERSHIPLHKWLFATHLIVSSKKGMSALQFSRMLGLPTNPLGSCAIASAKA